MYHIGILPPEGIVFERQFSVRRSFGANIQSPRSKIQNPRSKIKITRHASQRESGRSSRRSMGSRRSRADGCLDDGSLGPVGIEARAAEPDADADGGQLINAILRYFVCTLADAFLRDQLIPPDTFWPSEAPTLRPPSSPRPAMSWALTRPSLGGALKAPSYAPAPALSKAKKQCQQSLINFETALAGYDAASSARFKTLCKRDPPGLADVVDTVDQIVASANKRHPTTSRRFATTFIRVLERIRDFASIGDVFVGGAQNMVASGVWGAVRVAIEVQSVSLKHLQLSTSFV